LNDVIKAAIHVEVMLFILLRASPRVPNIFTPNNPILGPLQKVLGTKKWFPPTIALYLVSKNMPRHSIPERIFFLLHSCYQILFAHAKVGSDLLQ